MVPKARKSVGKGGNRRMNRDQPNCSNVEIGQINEKAWGPEICSYYDSSERPSANASVKKTLGVLLTL